MTKDLLQELIRIFTRTNIKSDKTLSFILCGHGLYRILEFYKILRQVSFISKRKYVNFLTDSTMKVSTNSNTSMQHHWIQPQRAKSPCNDRADNTIIIIFVKPVLSIKIKTWDRVHNQHPEDKQGRLSVTCFAYSSAKSQIAIQSKQTIVVNNMRLVKQDSLSQAITKNSLIASSQRVVHVGHIILYNIKQKAQRQDGYENRANLEMKHKNGKENLALKRCCKIRNKFLSNPIRRRFPDNADAVWLSIRLIQIWIHDSVSR